ncbi:MAG TPA: type I phosphomannose isomerase catalytic subunit [Gemmataceae bacterium]|nr:type I phosphomannose isomerase catalytic subunit [Gemmataceae bacterium]
MNSPLRFVPFLRPMVWGGRRLAEVLGKSLPTADPYGESWEISDHRLHHSLVANGPLKGRSLRDLMTNARAALLGKHAPEHAVFPWLVKFLDASDWLSVQVHPDTEAVRRLWPGEGSKTEAWFVLAAEPKSRIYAGLLPGTDEAKLRAALESGTVAECLHHFKPSPGDCIFLPAGTVHAVGGGVLMAEVQQTSDATFRLFDWNRRDAQGNARELHIEQSLACIDWARGPVYPVQVHDFATSSAGMVSAAERIPLVKCPFFELEYRWENEPFTCGGDDISQVMIVVRGGACLSGFGGEEELHVGQMWILPAAMSRSCCRPDPGVGILVCTLP